MSLSERISKPHTGGTWFVPSRKAKKVKSLGELTIIFGVIFIVFGVFAANGAGASEIEPNRSASDLEGLLPLVPYRSDLETETNVLTAEITKPLLAVTDTQTETSQSLKTPLVEQLVPKESFELQVEPLIDAAVDEAEEVDFEGARVRAGYVLPVTKIDWFDEPFIISHYTYALEEDPLYANDKKVSVPGLPKWIKLREGFVFGGRGIIQQGTGITENGVYVSIDWNESVYDENDVSKNRWVFKFGVGRPVEAWETVAVRHPDLPPGTKIYIENYGETYNFVVGDAGLDLAENQIDIFVGPLTISEADELGVQRSRIGIVRPIGYFAPQDPSEVKE